MSVTDWEQSLTDGKQSVTHWEQSVTDGSLSVTDWEQSLTEREAVTHTLGAVGDGLEAISH